MSFLDVHTFDGKWNVSFDTCLTVREKQKLFEWLLVNIDVKLPKDPFYANGKTGLQLVIRDTQHHFNYDATNKVYADDILAEMCIKMLRLSMDNRLSILHLILEQMHDMFTTGQCSQGRSTRLYQLYKSLA